jgi:outer membrane receptor for ferrienterochelin and colicin
MSNSKLASGSVCRGLRIGALSVACVVVAAFLSPIPAQSAGAQAAVPAVDDELQEVVVTGSYFAGQSTQQGALEVVGAEELQKSAKSNIAALLADLPSTQGNLITGGSNDSNNSPAMTINLRGLGTRATLILLNGQRQVATSEPNTTSDSFAVDLNALVPSVLVERVEILKDGASALYGSDAVAGVVNFITRKNLEGIIVQADGGMTGKASRKNSRIGIAGGLKTDKTSVSAGLEFAHQDQILTTDTFDDPARIATFGQTSGFGNPATFFPNGVSTPDPLCASGTIGGAPVGGLLVGRACRFDLTQYRGMVAQLNRAVLYSSIDHKVSDQFSVSAELGAAINKLIRFNSIGFPVNTAPLTVPATNPGNPFGNIAPYTVNYRFGSVFLNTKALTDTSSQTYRVRLRAQYRFSDAWRLEVGGAYGLNESRNINSGYYNMQRLQAAINCQGGASANLCFNPFASSYLAAPGSALYNSPAVLNWITSPILADSHYTLMTADLLLTGELFKIRDNAPVQLALGAQRRREATAATRDALARSGGLSFGGAIPDYSLGRSVNALFAELQIPLASTFGVNAAARMEQSSPGGSSVSPKIGFNWQPLSGLTISGSVGKSQRAPGLLQFTSQSTLANIARDPVTGTSQNGFAVSLLPSTDLKPESSINFNVGVDWSHEVAGGAFSVNIDAWNIDFKDLITATDVPSFVLANPTGPQVIRNPGNGQILLVTVPGYRNANKLALSGLDFSFSYSHDVGNGKVRTRFGGTAMNKYDFTTAAGVKSSFLGNINTALPAIAKTLLNWRLGYSIGANDASLTANYKSALKETTPGLIGISQEKAFTTIDFSYQRRFRDSLSFSVSIANMFDAIPPAQANNIYTTYANAYPLTGRTYNIGVRKEF